MGIDLCIHRFHWVPWFTTGGYSEEADLQTLSPPSYTFVFILRCESQANSNILELACSLLLKFRRDDMNVLAAIVAGIVGTIIMTMMMGVAPRMGLPKMDIIGMLGTMFGKPNRMLGTIMHLMMGVIFAIIYAFLWDFGIGSASLVGGILFGVVHWLITGMMMGLIPMMHVGIKSGNVPPPGLYMTNNVGVMGFVGGLIGHMIFGLVVALVYALF